MPTQVKKDQLDPTVYSSSLSRQAIINGNFDVWQRATTKTNPTNNTYHSADRWVTEFSLNGATLPSNIVHSKQPITPGDLDKAFNFYRVAPDGAGTSWGVNTFYMNEQRIENGTRYLCGNSKKVTISFWARSSISGKKLSVGLSQNYGTGGSPTTEEQIAGTVFSLTSSWVEYKVTLTTNTLVGKTFGSANDDYLQLSIGYAWGTTFGSARFGSATTETFVGSGNIDVAKVQLCSGDVALSFQPKSFAQELQDCWRYCWVPETAQTLATLGMGMAYDTTLAFVTIKHPVTMRIIPTLTATAADWALGSIGVNYDLTGINNTDDAVRQTKDATTLRCTTSGITANRPLFLQSDGNANRLMILSAEL